MLLRKFLLGICVVLLALTLGARLAYAQEQQDNIVIIHAYSGPVIINSALEAMYQDNRLFLPVSYLSEDVEVPITYDKESHRLTGWLENESNTVVVDFKNGTGRTGKNMFDFTADDYLYYEDELYLSVELVDKILNTISQFDFSDQSLSVITAGNLPFDKQLSRLKKQQRFDQVTRQKEAERLAAQNKDVWTQKNWLQMPFVDLSARYSLSKSKHTDWTDNLVYSANAAFLTGGFDSEFNAYASSVHEDPIFSFKTAREDETGHILGLFKHLELGDTYAYSNAENNSSVVGRGIKMSTDSLLSPDDKTYTFRDALPLGWEVELYRNGELLGYQNRTDDGYFEFADIPLLLGKNKFKLVFYGPQGQVKEKEQIIFFNGNVLNRGKGRLRLDYIDKNRPLIPTNNKIRDVALGHSAYIEAGYGLTDSLTLSVAAMAESLELYYDWPPQASYRKDQEYVSGNLSLFAYGIFSSLGTVVDLENSVATVDYYGQTSLWDWDITFQNIYYGKAVTGRNLFQNTTMENETSLRLNKMLSVVPWFRIPLSYTFRHFTVTRDSGSQTEHTVSLSQTLPFNIFTNLQYQDYHYYGGLRDDSLSLTANHVKGKWTMRGGVSYDFTYDRLYSTDFSVYRSITDRIKAGARYAYQSRSLTFHSYESLYSANLSYLTKYGYISLEAGTSNWHNTYGFIGYNMSFLPDVRNHRLYATGTKLQGTGALSAFAYMDANNNGTFDEGDTPLPDADVNIKPGVNVYDSHKKNSQGTVLLSHIPAYRTFDVDADITGIEDTLSLLNTAGSRTIKLRPAQVAYLTFPIVGTGDIEGTVYKEEGGRQKPFKGAMVNLYKDGQLIGNKVSEFDGYYSFSQVPLGIYTISIDPDQSEDLELKQRQEITVLLNQIEQLEVRDITLQSTASSQVQPEPQQVAKPKAVPAKSNNQVKKQKSATAKRKTISRPVQAQPEQPAVTSCNDKETMTEKVACWLGQFKQYCKDVWHKLQEMRK